MKSDSDFELRYASVLKECITLIEEESRHEQDQISLALKIGEKINGIVDLAEEKEAVFKRLARDIFKTRGKIVTASKISEYRQLYLNFQSMDTVTTLGKSMMNDMTIGMLAEMTQREGKPGSKSKEDDCPLLTMLKKVNRLLDRFEVAMEDNRSDDDNNLARIIEELKLVDARSKAILDAVQNAGGRSQLDLFRQAFSSPLM